MPENPIYDFMKANRLTDKDEATFLMEYSNSAKAKELFSFFQANKLTDKDFNTFYGTYLKKKVSIADVGMAAKGGGEVGVSKAPSGLTVTGEETELDRSIRERQRQATQINSDENDPIKSALLPIEKIAEAGQVQKSSSTSTPIARIGESFRKRELVAKKDAIEKSFFKNVEEAELFLKGKLDPTKLVPNKPLDITNPPTLEDYTEESLLEAIPQDNLTAKKAAEKFISNKQLREDISNSTSLSEAAIKNAVRKGDVTSKQITELGGDIPNQMKGLLVLNFLNNQELREEASKNPELMNQVRQEIFDLPDKYPLAAIRIMSEMVSKKREEKGYNNGILNMASRSVTDDIVNELVESGELPVQYKYLYEKPEVRMAVNSSLKTPGFVENLLTGTEQGLMGIGKTVADVTGIRNIYSDKGDRTFKALEKQYSDFAFKPKGLFHEITTNGGIVTGQVLPMMGGGSLIKAAGIVNSTKAANAIMAGLQTFGENKDRALVDLPGQSAMKQLGYATALTGIEVALSSVLDDTKLAKSLMKGVSPEVKTVINKFTNKEITAAAAKKEVVNIFAKAIEIAPTFLKGTGKVAVKEANEEAGTEILQTAANQVFGGEPIEVSQAAEDAFDVWRTTFLGSLFLGIGGGVVDVNKNPSMPKLIYEMAENPDKYIDIIEGQAAIDENYSKDVKQKIANLEYISKVKQDLDATEMSKTDKEKFLLASLNQKILSDQAESITEPTLKKKPEEKIKELEAVKQDILENPTKEEISQPIELDPNLPEGYALPNQSTIDQDRVLGDEDVELTLEQKILQQAIDNNEVDGMFLDMAKAAVTDPQQAKQLLDEAKSQATGQVAGELGNAREGVEKAFGKTIADFVAPSTGLGRGDVEVAKINLGKRVSGDKLLDAQDLIDELNDNKAEIDNDGMVTVYHRTTPENKAEIEKTGKMKGLEDGVFFSTKETGQNEGYGDAIVKLKIPVEKLELDDTFGEEAHVRIPTKKAGQIVDVKEYLPKDQSLSPNIEPKTEVATVKTKEETPTQETTPVSEPTTPPITQAKELADKVRKLKIDLGKLSGGGLQSNPLGLPVAVWNGAMDIIAKTIETGGNIADAIKRGLNYIQKNHRGQWNKKQFNDEVMKELGVRGITVNGEDLVVKDVDKEFAETINGFYSDLEQTILEVSPTDKGTPQAWLKKIGTGDEAKWTGVTDWLNSLPKDQKVTRKEILDWLKENRIQVVEVVKSDRPFKEIKNKMFSLGDEWEEVYGGVEAKKSNEDGDRFNLRINGVEYQRDFSYPDAKSYIEANADVNPEKNRSKFSQYQLEGQKENYKEVLVTLPKKVGKGFVEQNEDGTFSIRKPDGTLTSKKWSSFEEADKYNESATKSMATDFKSSHFDEPNILVHLRMNTRTDADGNKVLFLEEIQSDWGQKGKKEGFSGDYDIRLDPKYDMYVAYDKNGNKIPLWYKGESVQALDSKDKVIEALKESPSSAKTPQAPFVTETPSWTKLGLKVALKEAVKQGADKIAWTTGEQQNERYDLSKQVDELFYQKLSNGKYQVDADKDGKTVFTREFTEQELPNFVGKEVAEKIVKNEGKLLYNAPTYSGESIPKYSLKEKDLQIGGKGMKGFYGSPSEGKLGIVGEVAKSLFKQEPKTTEIETKSLSAGSVVITTEDVKKYSKLGYTFYDNGNQISKQKAYELIERGDRNLEARNEIPSTQHSIIITPELKAEVEGGLPLFKDIKGRGKEIADLLRKGKIKMGGLQSNIAGIPIAIYNAAIETIALALEGGATLTQAIQKAINKHKLNQQKGFNQKEFISKLEDATGEKFTDDQQEPPKPPKEEPSDVGIKHSVTEGIRAAYGLPEYERNNKTDKELEEEADQLISDGYNIESLISKLESGNPPSGVENFILTKYVADLDAKLAKSQDNETIAKLHRVLKATDKIGSLQSEAFRTRRYIRPTEETIGTFLMDEMEDAGVDNLTEEQKAKVTEEFEELKKANDALNQKIAELKEELLRKEAGEVISEERKRAKRGRKTDKEFAEERKAIVEDIREKLKKARQDTQSTVIPYAKELIAIAPDVAKLVKNLVDNGVVKLEDVISNIHEILKDEIQGITPKDVRDIIAGEYNEKKPTRNELAEKLKDLKDEAELLTRLEKLEESEIPKDEKRKIERNRRIKELRDKVKEHPNTKLSDAKSRIRSQISKIEEQIRRGDFSIPKKKEVPLDKEGKELQAKLINLRRDRDIRRLKLQYEKRTKWQKGMDKAAEVFNIPRSIMASTDFSAPLNQAIIATISNPLLALNAAKQMFKSAFSQKQFDQWFYEVKETPRYELMKELKLGISDPHSPYLTAREEAFMSGYAEQIPLLGKLIKGSERAYVQYLNKLRVDLFNKFIDRLEENGKTYRNSKEIYEKAAKYINNITGRGDLGKLEQFAPLFNGLLFSPRLMASRLNLINPVYFGTLPKELKKQYIKDMGSFLGLGSIILSLFSIYSKTQDDDEEDKIKVETDVRSSDFAKIKQGNTRWNIWGGFQPYVRLVGQIASGERKSSNTGLIQELDGNAAFGTSRGDVVASFFRGKLAPVPSAIVDLTSGRNAAGEEVTIKDAILTRVFPLSSQGIAEGWKDYGALSLLNIGIPSIFGVGTQTYEKKEKEIKDTIKRDGGKVKLTSEQFDVFEKQARKNIETNLTKLKGIKEYQDLEPEEKISLERVVSNKSVKDAEDYVINKYGLLFELDSEKVKSDENKKEILEKLNSDNSGW